MRNPFILLLLLSVSLLSAQTNVNVCIPSSDVEMDRSSLSQQSLYDAFQSKRPRYKETDVQEVIEQVKQCNQLVEKDLEEINKEAYDLSIKYIEVVENKDVAGIKKSIKERKASRATTQAEIQKSFSKVRTPGIFIVLLQNIDDYGTKPELQKQARIALEHEAVNNLIGTSMSP